MCNSKFANLSELRQFVSKTETAEERRFIFIHSQGKGGMIKIILTVSASTTFILKHFLSSVIGASMSPFIGRSVGWSVGRSVCQKNVKKVSKIVKKEVSRLLMTVQVNIKYTLTY